MQNAYAKCKMQYEEVANSIFHFALIIFLGVLRASVVNILLEAY